MYFPRTSVVFRQAPAPETDSRERWALLGRRLQPHTHWLCSSQRRGNGCGADGSIAFILPTPRECTQKVAKPRLLQDHGLAGFVAHGNKRHPCRELASRSGGGVLGIRLSHFNLRIWIEGRLWHVDEFLAICWSRRHSDHRLACATNRLQKSEEWRCTGVCWLDLCFSAELTRLPLLAAEAERTSVLQSSSGRSRCC